MRLPVFQRLWYDSLPPLIVAIVLCPTAILSAAEDPGQGSSDNGGSTSEVGPIGDMVIADDQVTLVVSRPSKGQLIYFDTADLRRSRQIELDFAPNRLAVQGNTIYASVRGAGIVYALDRKTGEQLGRYKLPGEPVIELCCHRVRGPIFAANLSEEVFAIDPKSGGVTKTAARGTMLEVDPTEGKFLLAGTNRPGQDFVEVQRGDGAERLRLVTVINRATVLKYAIENGGLRLIAGNTNAAFGAGGSLAISRDGSRYALAAGGGWRSLIDKRYHYVVAVFATADMQELLGQVEIGPYPAAVAFHPRRELGAAIQHGGRTVTIRVFKSNSLTERQTIDADPQLPSSQETHRMLFCPRDATIIHHYRDTLSLIPLAASP